MSDFRVLTEVQLGELGEKLAGEVEIGFDTECTTTRKDVPRSALRWDMLKMCGFSFGLQDGSMFYVPLHHREGRNAPEGPSLELLSKVMADPGKTVWAHNWKYDLAVLLSQGIDPAVTLRDSMILQWLLGKGLDGKRGHKLKPAVETYLGHRMLTWDETVPEAMFCDDVHSRVMSEYAADDALQTMLLGLFWKPELVETGMEKVFSDLEMPTVRVLRHMEDVGFRVDCDFLDGLEHEFKAEMVTLEAEFKSLVGCNLTSNQEMSKRLYDTLKWWPTEGLVRGKSGYYSVNSTHREIVEARLEKGSPGHRAAQLKSRHSGLQKLYTTYTYSLAARAKLWPDVRARSSYLQHGTGTGRFSSNDPNFQNIPVRTPNGKRIRQAFVAEQGWELCDVDYSQFELRIMAHLSNDENMLRAYRENIDIHQQTADACNVDRQAGKVTNLGLIYEMGPKTLADNLECSQTEARLIHRKWFEQYPKVKNYHRRMHEYAQKNGYVRSITGRVMYVPEINSDSPGMRAYAERTASNYPDQGSAADIMKIAMRNLYRVWKEKGVLYDVRRQTGKAKIVAQVHDELICELREDFKEEGAADIQKAMEGAVTLRCPLVAEPGFGHDWLAAKDAA